MNRTEHQLQMSFDPEYEARNRILFLYRKASKKKFIELVLRPRWFMPVIVMSAVLSLYPGWVSPLSFGVYLPIVFYFFFFITSAATYTIRYVLFRRKFEI